MNNLNYASTGNIWKVMKFSKLCDKISETNLSGLCMDVPKVEA